MDALADWGKVLIGLAAIAAALPGLRRQWRTDRPAVWRSARNIGLTLAFALVGVGVVMALAGGDGDRTAKVVPMIAFLLAWVGFSALWLARSMPRREHLPDWVVKPWSLADKVLLVVIVASFLWLLA